MISLHSNDANFKHINMYLHSFSLGDVFHFVYPRVYYEKYYIEISVKKKTNVLFVREHLLTFK